MNEGLSPPDSFIDQILDGKYLILSVLGIGAKGTVYKARHLTMDSFVAIKILHRHLLQDKTSQVRFKREAMIASQLLDPCIVRVNNFSVTDDGVFYLVMEYLQGESLAQCIEHESITSLSAVLSIGKQIAKALRTAEAMKIIHRDLKPANIFVLNPDDPEPSIKILDFGLAKIVDQEHNSSQTLTQTKTVVGSPAYMSPEQCMQKNLDIRSDIYSFGCVLYELLYGTPPVIGTNDYETMSKQLREMPRFPAKLVIPKELKKITEKCLAKSPENRYQNCQSLLLDLNKMKYDGRMIPKLHNKKSPFFIVVLIILLVITLVNEFIQQPLKPESETQKKAVNRSLKALSEKNHAGGSAEFWWEKADWAMSDENYATAYDYAKRAAVAAGNSLEQRSILVCSYTTMARALYRQGKAKEALLELEKAIAAIKSSNGDPQGLLWDCYHMKAVCYNAAGDYKQCTDCLYKALACECSDFNKASVYETMASIALIHSRYENARKAIEKCLNLSDQYKYRDDFVQFQVPRKCLQLKVYAVSRPQELRKIFLPAKPLLESARDKISLAQINQTILYLLDHKCFVVALDLAKIRGALVQKYFPHHKEADRWHKEMVLLQTKVKQD